MGRNVTLTFLKSRWNQAQGFSQTLPLYNECLMPYRLNTPLILYFAPSSHLPRKKQLSNVSQKILTQEWEKHTSLRQSLPPLHLLICLAMPSLPFPSSLFLLCRQLSKAASPNSFSWLQMGKYMTSPSHLASVYWKKKHFLLMVGENRGTQPVRGS